MTFQTPTLQTYKTPKYNLHEWHILAANQICANLCAKSVKGTGLPQSGSLQWKEHISNSLINTVIMNFFPNPRKFLNFFIQGNIQQHWIPDLDINYHSKILIWFFAFYK